MRLRDMFIGGALASAGWALPHLLPSQASASEPMPVICKAPDPDNIDGVCRDGTGTRVLMGSYQVVELKSGTYLVGWE